MLVTLIKQGHKQGSFPKTKYKDSNLEKAICYLISKEQIKIFQIYFLLELLQPILIQDKK